MPFNVSNILSRSAIAGNVFPGPLTKSYGSAAAPSFNPITDLPWDAVWQAGTNTFKTGTTPAANGETVQNWGDAVAGTSILTQATSGKRPTYNSSVAGFNNKATVQGNVANAVVLRWARSSAMSPPYTVVVVGAFPTGISSYSSMVCDYSSNFTYVWNGLDSINYESFYQGSQFARGYSSTTNLYHAGSKSGATSSRFGRNGMPLVGTITANNLNGLTLFSYGSSDALYCGGHVAFVGILPEAVNTYAKWPQFLAWVESYYGIGMSTMNRLILDGDSRTTGASDATGLQLGAVNYIPTKRFGQDWGGVLKSTLTNPVEYSGQGWGGRTMATQITDFPNYIVPIMNESVGATKIVVAINAGNNDVIADGQTGAQAYARVCTYIDLVHAQGWKILTGTCAKATGLSAGVNTERINLNTLLLANAGSGGGNGIADGVVDIANDANTTVTNPFAFVDATTPWTPANFNADYTHWSVTGNSIVAGLVQTSLAAAPFNVT